MNSPELSDGRNDDSDAGEEEKETKIPGAPVARQKPEQDPACERANGGPVGRCGPRHIREYLAIGLNGEDERGREVAAHG